MSNEFRDILFTVLIYLVGFSVQSDVYRTEPCKSFQSFENSLKTITRTVLYAIKRIVKMFFFKKVY